MPIKCAKCPAEWVGSKLAATKAGWRLVAKTKGLWLCPAHVTRGKKSEYQPKSLSDIPGIPVRVVDDTDERSMTGKYERQPSLPSGEVFFGSLAKGQKFRFQSRVWVKTDEHGAEIEGGGHAQLFPPTLPVVIVNDRP